MRRNRAAETAVMKVIREAVPDVTKDTVMKGLSPLTIQGHQ